MTQTTESTALIVPGLGLAIDLAHAEPLLLAEAVDELAGLKGEMTDAESVLREELVKRLDKTGKWTQRYRHGDVEYEVKAPSPDVGTTTYDVPALRERLRAHLGEGDIDPDAADAALEQRITVTFRVSLHHDANPEKMADTLRGAQSIEVAGTPVVVEKAEVTCRATAAGMTALGKIPALKETVEAVTVTLPGQQRKATVKRKTKEG